ncbi:ParB/Srx family N-terminal domain-containing protein [Geobacillus thermodenitrificans subsp. calidus]
MNIEIVRIDELKHPEKNVRVHTKRQLQELYRSYKQFGQYRPVVVDENNMILVGNGFVEALREYGVQEVKALRYTNLSENKKKKLMIADNQIYSLGFDNSDVILELLSEIDDFDIPGYDEDFLRELMASEEEIEEEIERFGILDEDTIETLKRREEARQQAMGEMQAVQPTTPTIEPSVESSNAYVPSAPTDPVRDNEPQTDNSATRTITCPHCGETFSLPL